MGPKLLIIARYWNDIEWLEASLQHIESWEPDEIWLCEGNWDPAWPARSDDGTREHLEHYAAQNENVYLMDNVREDANYRNNQAETSNEIMARSACGPGDWVLVIDCDHFYFHADIARIKDRMRGEGARIDYFTMHTRGFIEGLDRCDLMKDSIGTKLPFKILPGARWIATHHLSIDGVMYCDIADLREAYLPDVCAMHYEGMRLPERLDAKYRIGNRKPPQEYRGGERLERMIPYDGTHPGLARPVLERLGYAAAGSY